MPRRSRYSWDTTRADFRTALTQRTNEDTEERQDSLDGQIVKAIHGRLFEETEAGQTEAELKVPEMFLQEGEPCDFLVVSELREMVNQDKPEKYHISADKIGKRLSALGLQTKKILSRQSKHRTKKAVVFVVTHLSEAFQRYDLPVFAKQSVTSVTKTNNYQEKQQDTGGNTWQTEAIESAKCYQSQNIENTVVAGFGNTGNTSKPEIRENASKSEVSPPVTTKKARAQL